MSDDAADEIERLKIALNDLIRAVADYYEGEYESSLWRAVVEARKVLNEKP